MTEFKGIPILKEQRATRSGEKYTTPQGFTAIKDGIKSASSSAAAGGPQTQYVCGDCNTRVRLGRGDAIRCSTCGHRVLYKERTRRMVQFEAR